MLKVEKKFVIGENTVDFLGEIKELSFYRSNKDDVTYLVRENTVIGEIYTDMMQGTGFISEIKEV